MSKGDVYAESCGQRYKCMVLEDFRRFRATCTSDDNWTVHVTTKNLTVSSRPPPPGTGNLNVIRVRREMPRVPPRVLFDNLHDAEYRKTWDDNMLSGYNICQLNPHNDVGYYGCKFPWPLANRDFCNMRSWMEFTNGEYIIFNHSEPHPDCPTKKGFTRAKSILSGFYVMPLPGSDGTGSLLVYLTHTDVCGSIPHAIINFTMQKGAPSIMDKLEGCAEKYIEYSRKSYPASHVHGWTTPKMHWDSQENYPASAVAAATLALMPEHGSQLLGSGSGGAVSAVNAAGGNSALAAENANGSGALAGSTNGASASGGAGAALLTTGVVADLQHQVQDLKRRLFLAQQRAGGALSLAPVAPRREEDPPAVQQYRALMNDATNTVDRMYIQEARVPTAREYLIRLHFVLEGLVTTVPVS